MNTNDTAASATAAKGKGGAIVSAPNIPYFNLIAIKAGDEFANEFAQFEQEQAAAEKFDKPNFSTHTQNYYDKFTKNARICKFLLIEANFEKFVASTNPESEYLKDALKALQNYNESIAKILTEYPNAARNEQQGGERGAAKRARAGNAAGISGFGANLGAMSLNQAQDTVYKIAAQLRNAQISGDSELESVLRLELQAAEARLNLLRKG